MKYEEFVIENSGNHYRRLRVPFGWIVECTSDVTTYIDNDCGSNGFRNEQCHEWRSSITFVFDPFHMWKVKTKKS